jgi:hypothetical protein
MIKTFLRHLIIDTCISIAFNEMKKNFPPLLDTSKLLIGEFINVRLLIGETNYILSGCQVYRHEGEYTYLKYNGLESPILLVTQNGNLVDVQGRSDLIIDEL